MKDAHQLNHELKLTELNKRLIDYMWPNSETRKQGKVMLRKMSNKKAFKLFLDTLKTLISHSYRVQISDVVSAHMDEFFQNKPDSWRIKQTDIAIYLTLELLKPQHTKLWYFIGAAAIVPIITDISQRDQQGLHITALDMAIFNLASAVYTGDHLSLKTAFELANTQSIAADGNSVTHTFSVLMFNKIVHLLCEINHPTNP